MKLMLRAKAKTLTKKITLISTAFVLAVSTLTASVPFILSQNANAVAGPTSGTWVVDTASEFQAALNDPSVYLITLGSDITATQSLVLSRSNVIINGNHKTLTGPSLSGWVTNGDNYGLKIYRASGVTLNSFTVTGANVGIQVNGSQVSLTGHNNVSGNVLGGIEVSKGAGVTEAPSLTLTHNEGSFNYGTETPGKPAIWTTSSDATVTATVVPLTKATHIVDGQTQYYTQSVNAKVAVVNESKNGATYGSLQAAIDAADATNVLRLETDIVLTSAVNVNKSVNINGNGKSLTTSWTGATPDNNAALLITASNVTVKNVTVQSTTASAGTTNKLHGINTWHATNVSLENITARNNSAGVVVGENSTVNVNGIHTDGNKWGYGINVDKQGSKLIIKGSNTYTETAAIYVDNRTVGTVVDTDNQYVVVPAGAGAGYIRDTDLPVTQITNPVDGLVTKNSVAVKGTATDNNLRHYYYQITRNGQVVQENTVLSSGITDLTLYTAATEGVYTAQIAARDKTGGGASTGKKSTSLLHTFTIDKSAPDDFNTSVTPNPVKVVDGQVTLSTTLKDALSNITSAKYTLYKDGTAEAIRKNVAIDATYGTKEVAVQAPISLNGLSAGTYRIQLHFNDQAGNQGKGTTSFVIDNDDISTLVTVNPIDESTSTPTIRGTVTWNANGLPAANQPVLVQVETDEVVQTKNATSVFDGTWSVVLDELEDDNYAAYAYVGSGSTVRSDSQTFVIDLVANTPIVSGGNNSGSGNGAGINTPTPVATDTDDDDSQAVNGGFPLTTAQQVLGSAAQSGAGDNGEVEGANTARNVAQAGTNNTDGNAFGLAWYWWLLILAGLATIIWWIIAAIRGRQQA